MTFTNDVQYNNERRNRTKIVYKSSPWFQQNISDPEFVSRKVAMGISEPLNHSSSTHWHFVHKKSKIHKPYYTKKVTKSIPNHSQ